MRLMRDLIGATLSGRYRLLTRIAGGGVGDVYQARDERLNRLVAVKVLECSVAEDDELIERFREEARAAARLTHPNIVSVYDWGQDEDLCYMVMEYVGGSDLRDLLVAEGSLEPGQAVEVVTAVCGALAAAHGAGLVHRDIKPENVLIASAGEIKVADFGIAAVADAERAAQGAHVPGTAHYLSPEQARGEEATPQSDVWAAGVLLAELLTGRLPLRGESDLRRRSGQEPVPPSYFVPSVPRDVDAIVMRACAIDPVERFEDAGTMAAALGRVAARSVPDAPPVTSLVDDLARRVHLPDAGRISRRNSRAEPRRTGRQRRRRLRLARLAVVLAGLGALVWVGGNAVPAVLGPAEVAVPDLVGLSPERADHRAEAVGLDMKIVDERRTLAEPEGRIVAQSRTGGQLKEGSTLRVVLSSGPPKTKVPPVTGLLREGARERLQAAHLRVGRVTSHHSARPAGLVLAQRPTGGKLERGAGVDLVLSAGLRPVTVPDVLGMTEAKATKTLEAAGFRVEVGTGYSNSVPEGEVISTAPGRDVSTRRGSKVEVVVSSGPQYRKVQLPDVRNLSSDAARRRLESLGLTVTIVDSCGGGTTVVETEPIAGSTVRQGDKVALYVC
ncbi:Stk1 family PASTA domain-containing Ser/Thr kinase [soil metagenome]